MSTYIWLCTLLPTMKRMKEVTWRRKEGENLSIHPDLPLPLCLRECVQAFHWQSSRMMEQGCAASIMTNAHRRYQLAVSCTIAPLYAGTWPSHVHPSCCLPAGQRKTSVGRTEERRADEGKHASQQVHYHCYYLSLHQPVGSHRARRNDLHF